MLDVLYAQAAGVRRRYYERRPETRRRLRQPVVSIGNLSVGGTGKTPLVIKLAEWLTSRGETPAVLSRGYGRRDRRDGVVVVSDGHHTLASYNEAGDEPLMIAQAVPGTVVTVSEDRYLAGVVAERRLGATVHILDDGFQHVQLARDFDVLMTSPGEISGGRVLPFGRLREAPGAAARADFVVVVDGDAATTRSEAWTLGISQSSSARRVIEAPAVDDAVLAVAGVAKPEIFFSMLREAGYRVAATLAFRDHYSYTTKDVAQIAATVRSIGATAVVTTAKDAVRLHGLGPLPMPCVTVPMRLEIEEWTALTASIEQALARARESA